MIFHHLHHDHSHGHHHAPAPAYGADIDALPAIRSKEILYIDAFAGASGDMFLGALVDLGANFEELAAQLSLLDVPGFRLERQLVTRHTIGGTRVVVHVEEAGQPHRHVGDLEAIIAAAPLSARVKERSARVLRRLAEAEAAVHRMPIEDVHLHEVGGLDCLVDVVGTCLALEAIGVDALYCGPVSVGCGTVVCAHGRMPLPAPGTLENLRGFPIRRTQFEGEMTTPTGAAIITALARPVHEPLTFTPGRIGYGAGSRDKEQIANLLRIIRGRMMIAVESTASAPPSPAD